jgi:hypothetical protein
VKAIEVELVDLMHTREKAAELIVQIKGRITERRELEAAESLVTLRDELIVKQDDLEVRFHQAYTKIVEVYQALMAEYNALENERTALNASVRRHASKFKRQLDAVIGTGKQPPPLPGGVALLERTPFCAAYNERVALPVVGLDHEQDRWTPMAHAGKWWKPVRDEGLSPEGLKKLREDMKAREDRDKAAQAELDKQIKVYEGTSKYHDRAAFSGRPPPYPYGPQPDYDDIAENQAQNRRF